MAKAREIPDCCTARADEGALLVLRTRLDELFSFGAAALEWSDPEGVHDMRVASRRLRSALGDFRPYLRKSQFKLLRRRVKEIADALGEVRDEDVSLAAIEEITREAPPELAPGLAEIAGACRERREQARARLASALEVDGLARLREELFASLTPQPPPDSGEGERDEDQSESERAEKSDSDQSDSHKAGGRAEAAPQTFREAGRQIVERRLRQLLEHSAGLFHPHDSEGQHDLRIAAKKLRYALELFSDCYDDRLKPVAKEIARLQSSLGHLHDCDAWLEDMGARLAPEGEQAAPAASHDNSDASRVSRRATLWLFRHFAAERARHYEEALARWHAWENYGLLAHTHEVLRSPSRTRETRAGDSSEESVKDS